MKRLQFYIILALAVLLTAALVFWHFSSQSALKENLEEPTATNDFAHEANMPLGHVQNSTNQNRQPLPTPAKIDAMGNQTIQKIASEIQAQSEKTVADRSKPIAFFGKVVDEATQAVAGASIHFIWVDPKSTSTSDTTSAADGSFSLTDVVGGSVSVYLSKTGYYEIKSLNETTFNNTGNDSSRENPVLFHLRKKGVGADLITSQSGFSPDFRISAPLDGTPVFVDFLNRKVGATGQVEISQNKPEYLKARQATTWSFKMEIPDGGFIEESDEFPFEAPESGYQSVVEFKFEQGQPDWATDVLKDYYIKFGNPAQYGHLHLETTIGMDGARLTYAINPDGLRYLEPKQ